MSVYVGSTGKIIGPKGAKIQEIKKASNVTDIKMPPKTEGGDRPKARDPVDITIIGKPRAIAKAREMIQEVVNEWVRLHSRLYSLPSEVLASCGTSKFLSPSPSSTLMKPLLI